MRIRDRSGRIFLFDNMKFFLILTVVVGHFADAAVNNSHLFKSIFIFIYAFHMPMFLFCSGLFHSNKDVFIKAFRYISVGFASKIFSALVQTVCGDKVSFELLKDTGLPWYMFVLAFYIVITYGLRNVDKKYLLIFSVLLALFVGYDKSIGDYLYLSRAVVFYPFYLCGQLVSKRDVLMLGRSKTLKIAAAAIIAVWFIVCFAGTDAVTVLRPLFTGRNPFAVNELFVRWGFLYRALCYIITLLVSVSIFCLMPRGRLPVITDLGSRTLQVYLWHWPFILLLVEIGLEDFLTANAIGKIVWLVLGVALTFILSLKPFEFPTKQIFKYCRLVSEAEKPVLKK